MGILGKIVCPAKYAICDSKAMFEISELLYFRIYYGIIAKLKQLQQTYGTGSKPLLDVSVKKYQEEVHEAKRMYQPSIVSTVSGMLKSLKRKFSEI